jgi:xanthine dehydrogenase large subunit
MHTAGSVRFVMAGQIIEVRDFDPQLTVLDWLRTRASRPGSKEGCAEGDCGACTVVLGEPVDGKSRIRYRSVNSCIQLLAMLDGRQLITVEDLQASDRSLHPVQQAMVDQHGSQCGFCTPGFVMSLFSMYHQPESGATAATERWRLDEDLAGNLCRCTGYAPILRAASQALTDPQPDRFTCEETETLDLLHSIQRNQCLRLEFGKRLYFAPVSIDELCELLAQYPDAVMVAGATDVGLWITKQQRVMNTVIYLGRVTGLQTLNINESAECLEIGAAVSYSDAMDSLAGLYPEFRPLLSRLGATQVRNAGTIGGNIANGSPIGDMPPPLIALNARLVLRSMNGQRNIRLQDFFIEYGRQDLHPGECVEKVLLPLPSPQQLFRVYKLSKRFEQDISSVCGAFSLEQDGELISSARICFGGMAGVPKRASACEAALTGQEWNQETVGKAQAALSQDFEPISDWRASDSYRMCAAQNLLQRFFLETSGKANLRLEDSHRSCVQAFSPGPPGPGQAAEVRAVHNPIAHDSAVKHVTGEAVYVDDILEPSGLLHVYVGTSSCAHGRITAMDLSRVESFPGVAAVITARDIPGLNDVSPMHTLDEEILCSGEIQFHGQVLFAVAADDRDTARRAARLAVVEVDALPAILDIETALEHASWVDDPHEMKRGDARAAITASAHRLSGELETGGQDHFYLEGQASMAIPLEDGDLLIQSSSQHPSELQHLTAQALDRPDNAVTVEVRRMGGAFGGKETQAAQWAIIAALVASRTGRPAKIRLDRDDDMISTGKRHDFLIRYDVGFDSEGRIEGIDLELAARCGMAADLSGPISDRAMFHCDNAYYLPNVNVKSWRCRSNTVSNTALRGFGGPQGMMGIERVIDAIAAHLGKDPFEVRQLNLYGRDERNVTPYHMTIEDNVLPELLADLATRSDYRQRREEIAEFNRESTPMKRGIALTPVKFGISFTTTFLNQAGALVHVYKDGSIHLNHGGTEMGQGLMTKVAQVVADGFRVGLDRIKISPTNTGKVPNTSATAASSGSDMNSMAALDAVRKIKQRLRVYAAGRYGVGEEEVVFEYEKVIIGGQTRTFPELVMEAYLGRVSLSATGFYRTPKIHYDRKTASGRPFLYFAYGAAVSEVEVDTLTGEHRLRRVDILHDVGRSLNPALDLGQIEGGFVQGAGWLTSEELWWDEDGGLRTHSPSTYKIPTGGDLPAVLNVDIWEQGRNREPTIHRSKAVGEPPLMLAISVHSAICQAISSIAPAGQWPDLDAPATPEKVLMCIRDLQG